MAPIALSPKQDLCKSISPIEGKGSLKRKRVKIEESSQDGFSPQRELPKFAEQKSILKFEHESDLGAGIKSENVSQTDFSSTTELLSPKSSLKRKRDSSLFPSIKNEESSQNGLKQLKVSFDDEPEVRYVDDLGEQSLSYIREEVRLAIQGHVIGENKEYEKLKDTLGKDTASEEGLSKALLCKYLLGLISNITILTKQCSDLVETILDIKWLGQEDVVVDVYAKLLGHLVSSQSGNIGRVLKMLVGNLAKEFPSAGEKSNDAKMDGSKLRGRIHNTLRFILQLVPSASVTLSNILSSSFPFPTDTVGSHVHYVKNILRVSEYTPELKTEILDLIMERLVKIDVQIQIDVEDLEEDATEDAVPNIPQLNQDPSQQTFDFADLDEDYLDEDDDADSILSDESIDEESLRIKDIKASVTKLDIMLQILFTHYEPHLSNTTNPTSHALFSLLTSQYRRTILPTNRSRFAQFLIFRFSQHSPELTNRFIDATFAILTDRARPSLIRTSAAAYLASFTARAARISSLTVLHVFQRLASYADTQRKELEPHCRHPGALRATVYYSCIQALLYIYCFRWRDLLHSPNITTTNTSLPSPPTTSSTFPYSTSTTPEDSDSDEASLLLTSPPTFSPTIRHTFALHLHSRLNPLKILSPHITAEFARLAHHLRFMYIYPLLEANKRVRVTGGGGGRDGSGSAKLDAYFPFDPCRLPRCRRWVEECFVEWRGVPGLDDVPAAVEDVVEESAGEGEGEGIDDEERGAVAGVKEESVSADEDEDEDEDEEA